MSALGFLITAPVTWGQDIPEGLEWWNSALADLGGDTAKYAVLIVTSGLFFLGAMALLIAQRGPRSNAASVDGDDLRKRVTAHLIGIIEEGRNINRDFFTEPEYGVYTLWRTKTAQFLGAVFGALEQQRFREAGEPDPANIRRQLHGSLQALRELRDQPERWSLRVDAVGLEAAAYQRRALTLGEQIVRAQRPTTEESADPQGDPLDLAKQFTALATAVDEFIADRASKRAASETKSVAEILSAATPGNYDETRARLEASKLYWHNTALLYERDFSKRVAELYDEAEQHGVVAGVIRSRVTNPDQHQLPRVPGLLRIIAERLVS